MASSTVHVNRSHTSPAAAFAFGCSLCAGLLAVLGVYSPWGALRFPVEMKLTGIYAVAGYGATFILPIVLGAFGSLLGGHAMTAIEESDGKLVGDGYAFFAVMLGMFAVICGGVCTFAGLVWPML